MSIPLRLDACLAKIETTYRTDPTPTAGTDGVRVAERLWPSITPSYAWENLREDVATGTLLGATPAIPRGRRVSLEIPWECRGAGSDAVVEADPLIRACGWAQTDGSSLFSYAQASNLHESCTIWAYAAGLLFKVVGCRGTLRWRVMPGQISVKRFSMQGIMTTDPAAIAVPAVTYDSTEPLAGVSIACTVGSWTPKIISAEFIQNADVQQLDDANDAQGIGEFGIGAVNHQFLLSARVPRDAGGIWDSATYNPYADSLARTARAIVMTVGGSQFNRLKLLNASGYVAMPGPIDNNRFSAWDLRYGIPAGATIQSD